MLKTIHKETLAKQGLNRLWLPVDAIIVSIETQLTYVGRDRHVEYCMWYEFELNEDGQSSAHGYDHRNILMFGTGHMIDYDQVGEGRTLNYVGMLQDGRYVWHFYEDVEARPVYYGMDEAQPGGDITVQFMSHEQQEPPAPDLEGRKCNYCEDQAVGIFTSIKVIDKEPGMEEVSDKPGPMKYMCAACKMDHQFTE